MKKSEPAVTTEGIRGERPGREATTGVVSGRRRGGRDVMVAPANFHSYYGLPVINQPVWASPNIPGYLFLGGLAGGSSLLAAGAHATGRHSLSVGAKAAAAGAGIVSLAALVHDLGRPGRFLNMLRVFKVTSPMNVGSWILFGYVPAACTAAACEVSGLLPGLGVAATAGAATLGPAVAAYTSALISDTAVPAWHEGHREMPFVFVSSAASAAGGAGMLVSGLSDNAPAVRMAAVGGATEVVMSRVMKHRMHEAVARHYEEGRAKRYLRTADALTALGILGALSLGRRSRLGAAISGAALLGGSACTRFGIFSAGYASASDPAATITPQRERLSSRLS